MAQPLHLTMEGTNPLTMSEWLWFSSFSLGGNLDLENTKLLPEVLELHPSQWICQHIIYLFLRCNILELHCSPLHHIPDIVILDLDMLRLVMHYYISIQNLTEKSDGAWISLFKLTKNHKEFFFL